MQNLRVVEKDEPPGETPIPRSFPVTQVVQWVIGIVVAFALGTWLVWWGALLQRSFTMEDVRAACHRVMPETAERCVDTVIIQRGGARR
jgi:hypothetical protein